MENIRFFFLKTIRTLSWAIQKFVIFVLFMMSTIAIQPVIAMTFGAIGPVVLLQGGHCTIDHPTRVGVSVQLIALHDDTGGGQDLFSHYIINYNDEIVYRSSGGFIDSSYPLPQRLSVLPWLDFPIPSGNLRIAIHDYTDSAQRLPIGATFSPVAGFAEFDPVALDRGCAPPAVTGFSSNSGSHSGGSLVTITGEGFSAAAEVLIDGVAVDAADVSASGTTQIAVTMPPSSTGPGDVEVMVRTPAGTSSPEAFTYINAAPVAMDDAYTVTQGQVLTVPAPGILGNDSDSDGDSFSVNKVISSQIFSWPSRDDFISSLFGAGNGSFELAPPASFFGMTNFNYVVIDGSASSNQAVVTIRVEPSTPHIDTVSAGSGPLAGGTVVTISGSNFLGATGVTFGGIAATTYTVADNSTITATVPAGAARGPVAVAVHKVDAGAGMQESGTLPGGFTYLAPGALTVTPAEGLAASGPVGGPFGPDSKTWALENTGDEDIEVLVSTSGPGFFDVSNLTVGTPFTLAGQSSHDVTVSFGAAANALSPGMASGGIQFTNETNGSGNTFQTVQLEVLAHTTSLDLTSSLNPSLAGDVVTFTASLSGGLSPQGSVEFFADADSLGTRPIEDGVARLEISTLAVGSYPITAVYSGDANNAGSVSIPLTQVVEAMPEFVLRIETEGHDGPFAFSSPESALNLSITTSGGTGQSAPLPLRPGSYSVTMADRRGDGLLLQTISCSDTDSIGHVDTRSLDINLSVAETLVCTFTIANTAQQTLEEIASFLEARASVLLANLPNAQRRFARLKGQAGSVSSPGSILMGYLPVLVNGGTLAGSASLAQIEALAGHEQQPRFDAWIDGTFGVLSNKGAQGWFGLVALGADYLVTDDLLIGSFFQIDQLSQENAATAARAGGTGWMMGPYLTARLNENLYLDLMAAGGQAENRVSPLGTYEDWYGSTRFLASAALQGDWSYGAWTFAPAASATWFSETSNAYTDSLGVAIPSTMIEQAQFAAGPGVRHVQDLGGGITLSTNARFEAVAGYRNSLVTPGQSSVHGRISGGLDFGFEGGAALAFSLSHDGLFGAATRSTSVNVRLSAPLH